VASRRTYGDSCAAAHALDLVGERWALLVVRELLLGPKRFSDLRVGMPGVSANVLSQRLRELEDVGVLRRHWLEPPAGSWVYELTDWGTDLEPVLTQLGKWGGRSPLLDRDAPRSLDSLMLSQRARFSPAAAGGLQADYVLRVDQRRFSVHVADGRLEVERGDTQSPDATLETDAVTFEAVLTKKIGLAKAIRSGRLVLTGDTTAVERLFDALPKPALVGPA
jgi:DNA-binding HxlR family transcriptional regulator